MHTLLKRNARRLRMVRDTFQEIVDKVNIRENLIQLKEELREDQRKDTHNQEALLYMLSGNYDIFHELLQHEDAKVRKNIAIIMGILAIPEFLDWLYTAYKDETQLFVKSTYLDAIEEFDYRKLLPELKNRLGSLSKEPVTEENKKHLNNELRQLTKMILTMEGMKKHVFHGYHELSEMVLLTNRNHIHVTMEELGGIPKKQFSAGVIIKTADLIKVLNLRSYQELLFALPDLKTVSTNPNEVAKKISESSLLKFLRKRHDGETPFYFRLELKSKSLENKGNFIKRTSSELERLTERKLINSSTNYEIELRLIENKDGNYNLLIKLFTLKDERFAYRKETIATSIRPANAALTMALAKPYLKENAQVLDPFCGVGTMLMERDAVLQAGTMYGLDIFAEAIDKARINSKIADRIVNYINRDFFDFKHEYLFDEIITNMPFVRFKRDEEELYHLYQRFFLKMKEHLKSQGIAVLYTHNREFVKRLGNTGSFHIEKEFEISMKEGTYVFVIRYIG